MATTKQNKTPQVVIPQEVPKASIPKEIEEYVKSKVQTNSSGGRPHFLQVISQTTDPLDVLLEICERVWIRGKSIGSTARHFKTNHITVWRILQDIEPFKAQLVEFLTATPRRKTFWNRELNTSDYPTVRAYIRRATDPLDPVKSYRGILGTAVKVWKALKYRDPATWTRREVAEFLGTKSEGGQSGYLDAVRQIAPQIADKSSPEYITTNIVREKINIRKKDLFGKEIKVMVDALMEAGLTYHATIWKFHITVGAREGTDGKAGITGISWDRFTRNFHYVDDFETKAKKGILWQNCPVDLFWKSLPKELAKIWQNRGKPVTDHVILGGYPELLKMYKEIRKALQNHFKEKIGQTWKVKVWKRKMQNADAIVKFFIRLLQQKGTIEHKTQNLQELLTGHYEEEDFTLDPALFKEMTTLRPHDSDKIHCNLCWEAKIPVEVVAGTYLKRGKGKGLVGRGWVNTNTITKHYLSLSERSERFKQMRDEVDEYSKSFNGGH